MSKIVYFDTEFSDTNEEYLHPVCVSYLANFDGEITKETIWTLDKEGRDRFISLLNQWAEDEVILCAFYVIAEARFLLSLDVDPRRFKWIDLWIEYRMLLNHNNQLACGKHLIKGKVTTLRPARPKWEQEEGYSTGGKAEISLVACTYRVLGIKRDDKHKDAMRDLILSKKEFNEFEQMDIMDYCEEDIIHLPEIHKKLFNMLYKKYEAKDRKNIKQEIFTRGAYAVATALMEKKGYSIDYEATKSFSDSVPEITFQMQKEINDAFPEIGAFKISNKGDKYQQKKKPIQDWVKAQNIDGWEKTEKGDVSLKLDAFEEHFSHKDDQNIFGNRFVKFLRDKQSLNGFTANTTKKNLWDFVGRDQRVRPHFGIYVAQSSRSQPSATGYILLKSSWMRVLLSPPKGKTMIAIDYGQQEFLIAGLLFNDKNMLEAYHSGDPYLYTAKLAKAVPQSATKESHGLMRDKFKSTVLGIQFGMAAQGLAKKLTMDTGVYHSEDDSQKLIDMFEMAYPDYIQGKEDMWEDYKMRGYIKLPDGWTMFGDNINRRSALNMPVQGTGAAIMRLAVHKAQSVGLNVTMTLHDAIYCEVDSDKTVHSLEKLAWCMGEAFQKYFIGTTVEKYAMCRMDGTIWGSDWNGEVLKTSIGDIEATSKYIDKRRFEDYKKYRQFFVPKEDLELIMKL